MTSQLADLLRYLQELNLPVGDYAVFGSGPLAVRGIIPESNDLDIVCRGAAWERVRAEGTLRFLDEYQVQIAEFLDGRITCGTQWGIGEFSVDELIDTAELFDGLPFVRLAYVIDYKRIAGRPKDQEHIRAWRQHTSGSDTAV